MLYQIMNKAEANELIRRNPVACAEKMRSSKPMKAKEAFTADEVKRLMKGLPHDKYGDSIRLMLGTGIRMQELLALEPSLIEPDGSVLHIRQAVKAPYTYHYNMSLSDHPSRIHIQSRYLSISNPRSIDQG